MAFTPAMAADRLFLLRPGLLHLHRRLGAVGVVLGLVLRVVETALQGEQAAGKAKSAGEIHDVLRCRGLSAVTCESGNGCDCHRAGR